MHSRVFEILASYENPVTNPYVRTTFFATLSPPQPGGSHMDHRVHNVGILSIDVTMSSKPKDLTTTTSRNNTLSLECPNYSKHDWFLWTFTGNILWNSFKANHIAGCSTTNSHFVSSESTDTRKTELKNVDNGADLFNASVNKHSQKEKEWSFFLGCWHE